MKSSYQIDS